TFASYVAQSHHISYANANRTVRLARQLRDAIPCFGTALRAGRVGPDHIEALAATALTSPTRVAALAEPVGSAESEEQTPPGADQPEETVEEFLLDQARQLTVNQVRRLVATLRVLPTRKPMSVVTAT